MCPHLDQRFAPAHGRGGRPWTRSPGTGSAMQRVPSSKSAHRFARKRLRETAFHCQISAYAARTGLPQALPARELLHLRSQRHADVPQRFQLRPRQW